MSGRGTDGPDESRDSGRGGYDDRSGSGFGPDSTTDEVLRGMDLTGRRYLVTGSSGGLGAETARALTAHGATVVMAARDESKNRAVRDSIVAAHPRASLESVRLDLGDLASVRAACDSLLATGRVFDGVVNNAGVMATPEGRTIDGHETQFGVDHLGHFLLVRGLLPLLRGRVVCVSSAGHRMSDIDLSDVDFERRTYDPLVAYGAAKTANVLHAVGIDRRFAERGIRGIAIHPGGIHTELGRYMTPDVVRSLMAMISDQPTALTWKSVEAGAATQVWALTSPFLDGRGGVYCEDCDVSPVVRDTTSVNGRGVAAYAVDPSRADHLWEISERLVDRPATGRN